MALDLMSLLGLLGQDPSQVPNSPMAPGGVQADPNATAPTPQAAAGAPSGGFGGLMDLIGSHLGGASTINPAVAAQLGMDPAALQHQAAQQALLRFGTGMLAGAQGGGEYHKTFGGALAGGLQAAAAPGDDPIGGMLKQAMQSAQLAKTSADAVNDKRKGDAQDKLAASLSSGANPQMAAAMGMSPDQMSAFAGADPQGFATLSARFAQDNALSDRTDKQTAAAADRQDALAARQDANANARAQMAAAASDRASGAQARNDTNLAQLLVTNPAGTPMGDALRQLKGLSGPGAGQQTNPFTGAPVSKADQAATGKRATAISQQLDAYDKTLEHANSMQAGFQAGALDSGNPLSRYYNSVAPQAFRAAPANELDANANQLALEAQAALSAGGASGNRGSMLQLQTLLKSKPGIGMSNDENQKVITGNIIKPLTDQRTQLQAEADHYANGGSLASWNALRAAQPAPGGKAAPTATTPTVPLSAIQAELARRAAAGG